MSNFLITVWKLLFRYMHDIDSTNIMHVTKTRKT